MAKQISLNLPEETYENIKKLGEFFSKDEEQIIVTILDVIGSQGNWIKNRSKDYKVPIKFSTLLYLIFDASPLTTSLFNQILEKFEVNGLYTIADVEADFEEGIYLFFAFNSLIGNTLSVDEFYLTIEPGARLKTISHVEVEKNTTRSMEKLKIMADSDLLNKFDYLEEGHIEIEENDELWTMTIDMYAETVDYLPSIREVSKLVKNIFKRAGIK